MRATVALLWFAATAIPASKSPQFGDYPARVGSTNVAAPKLSRSIDAYPDSDPRFRDAAQSALKRGPNFSGHYTIVAWSCGTGCSNSVVVDTATGVLYRRTPFYRLFVGGQVGNGSEYSGLSFQVNSRLLIAEGCFGERSGCSRRFYFWAGNRFRLLQRIPLKSQ
jgi:hypothetical protein